MLITPLGYTHPTQNTLPTHSLFTATSADTSAFSPTHCLPSHNPLQPKTTHTQPKIPTHTQHTHNTHHTHKVMRVGEADEAPTRRLASPCTQAVRNRRARRVYPLRTPTTG